jgi:hypothetical protein
MRLLGVLVLVAGGCAGEIGDGDFHGEDEAEIDQGLVSGSVADQVNRTCTTSAVLGLSKQIADEIGCMAPGALEKFPATPGITFIGSAVLPYLAPEGVDALMAAAGKGVTVEITSGFRTVAQQHLLYRWDRAGRCGISVAATPGRSNHEGGRALDVRNWSAVNTAMRARGWSRNVPGDPVHFEHLASPDARGLDVHAFQRLWNRNNPKDRISEDGDYGPATAARLERSPALGFPVGACVK